MIALFQEDTPQDRLLTFFNNRKLIDIWLKALDTALIDKLMAGEGVGDLKVVAGRSNRKWAVNDDDLKEALKKDCKLKPKEMVEEKMKSPAKIEKLLQEAPKRGKEKKLKKFQELVTKGPGKPTVVHGDDKRDSIALQFEDLTKGE